MQICDVGPKQSRGVPKRMLNRYEFDGRNFDGNPSDGRAEIVPEILDLYKRVEAAGSRLFHNVII